MATDWRSLRAVTEYATSLAETYNQGYSQVTADVKLQSYIRFAEKMHIKHKDRSKLVRFNIQFRVC